MNPRELHKQSVEHSISKWYSTEATSLYVTIMIEKIDLHRIFINSIQNQTKVWVKDDNYKNFDSQKAIGLNFDSQLQKFPTAMVRC
jgi:hypothetical protein